MKILAIENVNPNTSSESYKPYLTSEATRVWELYQAGIIRELYFRLDRSEAVLILECSTVEEAHGILGSLPLVREGLITFDVIPLKPYPGFSRLFNSGSNR